LNSNQQEINESIEVKFDYDNLSKSDILGGTALYAELLKISDPFARRQAEMRCAESAKERGLMKMFKECLSEYKAGLSRAKKRESARDEYETMFPYQKLVLRCGGWIADENGVRRETEGGVVFASKIPIMPTALLKNIETGTEKVRLEFVRNGEWNKVIADRSVVASNNKIIELADSGIDVSSKNARYLVEYLNDCIMSNLDILPVLRSTERLGWFGDDFVPYCDGIVFDGEKQNKHLFDAVGVHGSFKEWTEYVSELRKNIYLRLQMAASFASPLIKRVGALPFIFHLWGGTGTGKTVGQTVAASIWGNPRKGKMWRTMDNTVNYVCNLSAFMHSFPVILDELQTIKGGESYDKLIMRCCEGTDRGRMSYDKACETRTWDCSYIFSGEEPIAKSVSGGGASNRVIEAEVKAGEYVAKDGNAVVRFVNENYGYAGIAFIVGILDEGDIALRQKYSEILNDLIQLDTTDKQASAMALLLLADRIACREIFKNETPLTTDDVAPYLKRTNEVSAAVRAAEYTSSLIAANVSRFMLDNKGEEWGSIQENGIVLINKQILTEKLQEKGFDFNAVKTAWANAGYLILNSQGKYTHQTKCYGVKASYIKLNTNVN